MCLPSLSFPLSPYPFLSPALALLPLLPHLLRIPTRSHAFSISLSHFLLNVLRDRKTLDSPGGAILLRGQRMETLQIMTIPLPRHKKNRAPRLWLQKRPEALESALGLILAWLPTQTVVMDLGGGLGTVLLVAVPTLWGSFLARGPSSSFGQCVEGENHFPDILIPHYGFCSVFPGTAQGK